MNIFSILTGNRTYIIAAAAIAYIIGSKLGWWQLDGELLAGAGLLCATFLRSAIARGQAKVEKPADFNRVMAFACVCLAAFMLSGCNMLKTTVKVPVYVLTAERAEEITEDGKVNLRNRAYSLWDAEGSLAKYSSSVSVTTNEIQIRVGFQNLHQASSGSNVVKAIEAGGGLINKAVTGN